MVDNQVKIYMDNGGGGGGGGRSSGGAGGARHPTNHTYNKLSQGPVDLSEVDLGMDSFDATQSQSRDCEPSPPLLRHGSKTNFFQETNLTFNHVPHQQPGPQAQRPHQCEAPPSAGSSTRLASRQNQQSQTPEGAAPPIWPGSDASPRSSSTPPPRSLTSPTIMSPEGSTTVYVHASGRNSRKSSPVSPPSASSPGQSPISRRRGGPLATAGMVSLHYGVGNCDGPSASMSPNRKFASESELVRVQAERTPNGHSNRTTDNLQDLANHTVLVTAPWNRSGHNGTDLAPRFPQSGGTDVRPRMPASHGGSLYGQRHRGGSSSPQAKWAVVSRPPLEESGVPRPHAATRPMSFLKALEMSDSTDKGVRTGVKGLGEQRQQGQYVLPSSKISPNQRGLSPTPQPPPPPPPPSQEESRSAGARHSVYDMNYEISV